MANILDYLEWRGDLPFERSEEHTSEPSHSV